MALATLNVIIGNVLSQFLCTDSNSVYSNQVDATTPRTEETTMTTTKAVQTTVTSAQLIAAQGGVGGGDDLLTVECPTSYRADRITAEDIVHDGAITLVRASEAV